MTATVLELLYDLLQDERELLLAGELNEINRLEAHKSKFLEELNRSSVKNVTSLEHISDLAKANSKLFEAASAGLRDARSRLGYGQASVGFRTYGGNGKISQNVEHAPLLERNL